MPIFYFDKKNNPKKYSDAFLMRLLFLTLLVVGGVLGVAGNSQAEIYYVDYEDGNDSSVGTSTNAAWKHCPGDPRASSNANTILLPGDTVLFKGGVTYSFDVDMVDYIAANGSGVSENVISYKSGHLQVPAWGNGRAIIDGTNADLDYVSATNAVISLKGHSYITVEGLQIQNSPFDFYNSLIGWRGGSGGHITINDNLLFSEISPPNSLTTTGVGILIQGNYLMATPEDFTITNNTIHSMGEHGILLRYGLSNVLIENNTIHDCGPGPAPYLGDGIFVSTGGSTSGVSTNLTIRGNELYNFPTKGCILLDGVSNGIVEKNYCHDSTEIKNGFGFTAASIGYDDNIIFRNNLVAFQNQSLWGGLIRIWVSDQGEASNLKYYNNTLVGSGSESIFKVGYGAIPVSNVEFINNIITGSSQFYFYLNRTPVGTFISDNNIFYGTTGGNGFYQSGTVSNLSTWQSSSGQDMQSLTRDPLLNSDYTPQSTSPSIDNGMAIAGFSDDYKNIFRPQGSAWDIGAYEYEVDGAETIIRADVNQDSVVNSIDASLTLRKSLGESMSGTNWRASETTGDVNCDGGVNTTDALLLLRQSLGLDMSGTPWCG